MRHIFLHAADADEFRSIAQAVNADEWHCHAAPSGRFVGHLVGGDHFAVKQLPNVRRLPSPHSPKDISQHAKDLGVPNVKSAYDLYDALFHFTGWEMLDPDR